MKRAQRGFALLEAIIALGVAAALTAVVFMIATQTARADTDRTGDEAARRVARNVATDVRAAIRYDAAAVAAIGDSGTSTWTVDGFTVASSVSAGELQITVSGKGANPASVVIPLVREAPPPGSAVGPGA